MKDSVKINKVKEFVKTWTGRGYERGESQMFWLSLLHNVLDVEAPETIIKFEDKVKIDHTSFIDGHIKSTHVLIEQKSIDKDLRKPVRQSDGSLLDPKKQAQKYSAGLPYSERPRWIVTCNFREFLIYDMERPNDEPESLLLEDLPKEYYRLRFLVDADNDNIRKETEISVKAGELVGLLYDELRKQYVEPDSERALKSLNMLCVRLVFCLYAEDSGLFGSKHLEFHDYISSFATKDVRDAIIKLFKTLDTKQEDRDPYMDDMLAAFPYVNGGLFADEDIEIPRFNEKIVDMLLRKASENFNWSEISPTIFGAVFESTLNPETRRSGGMHYTSIENIHKVIDPLFLNELKDEFESIRALKDGSPRRKRLEEFRTKLSSLTFLDPACGSGNFLTETYLSLRRLENEALKLIHKDQIVMGLDGIIKVSIGQFYGIEINDFAVTVAKTALCIAESQMMKETESIVNIDMDFLPLRSYANIVEGNALRIDWESVVPKDKLNYIMGNPPFVGYSNQNKTQKEDILSVYITEEGKPFANAGKVDYVAGWYFKAADLIANTNIKVCFVSTDSITQGEQVAAVWKPIYDRFNIDLLFAYRTFRWDSEANLKAQVHCVIIGFKSNCSHNIAKEKRFIYDTGDVVYEADNINAYLLAAPNIFVEARKQPICKVHNVIYGSKPADGGNLFFTKEELEKALEKEPNISKYVKRFLGAKEFLHNEHRYCLWLVNVSPAEIRSSRIILDRVKNVRDFRSQSKKQVTRQSADYPAVFQEIRQSVNDYVLIPEHTSGSRKYIPMGFESKDVICGNANLMLPNADLYDFGVLASSVHMAWTKTVCGYLGTSYRYSATIVYNNFPWPEPTDEQKAKIEQTAKAILDARALYPDSSLADLYDDSVMPVELHHAHQQNDKAVMQAYGFDHKNMTESECVAELMRMYEKLAKQHDTDKKTKKKQ